MYTLNPKETEKFKLAQEILLKKKEREKRRNVYLIQVSITRMIKLMAIFGLVTFLFYLSPVQHAATTLFAIPVKAFKIMRIIFIVCEFFLFILILLKWSKAPVCRSPSRKIGEKEKIGGWEWGQWKKTGVKYEDVQNYYKKKKIEKRIPSQHHDHTSHTNDFDLIFQNTLPSQRQGNPEAPTSTTSPLGNPLFIGTEISHRTIPTSYNSFDLRNEVISSEEELQDYLRNYNKYSNSGSQPSQSYFKNTMGLSNHMGGRKTYRMNQISQGSHFVPFGKYQTYHGTPSFHDLQQQAQKALEDLNISPILLSNWTDKMKRWLIDNVLAPISSNMKNINRDLKKLSMSGYDCNNELDKLPERGLKIPEIHLQVPDGRLTLRTILLSGISQEKDNSALYSNRLAIENYLDMPECPRQYLVERVNNLTTGYLSSFKWEDKKLDYRSDAEILNYVFCRFMDMIFPPDQYYGKTAFTNKHFYDRTKHQQPPNSSGLYITLESKHPPHFDILHGSKVIKVEPGRNNLFAALSIFVYLVKTNYEGFWLGDASISSLFEVIN